MTRNPSRGGRGSRESLFLLEEPARRVLTHSSFFTVVGAPSGQGRTDISEEAAEAHVHRGGSARYRAQRGRHLSSRQPLSFLVYMRYETSKIVLPSSRMFGFTDTTAVLKAIQFTSERHCLRLIVGGQTNIDVCVVRPVYPVDSKV